MVSVDVKHNVHLLSMRLERSSAIRPNGSCISACSPFRSLTQPLHRSGRGGCWRSTRDASAETLLRSVLWEAAVTTSGMGRDVHCVTLSIRHFLCRLRRGSLTLRGILKKGFGKAVVPACGKSKPCEFVCQVGVTVGDSGLCCCICVTFSSAN